MGVLVALVSFCAAKLSCVNEATKYLPKNLEPRPQPTRVSLEPASRRRAARTTR